MTGSKEGVPEKSACRCGNLIGGLVICLLVLKCFNLIVGPF
jgi:hypothetical protein